MRNGCVYLAAIGGAGALLSKCIKSSEVVAYEDLGTEAIRKLQVENLPVIVVIDSEGNNLYETAIREYKKRYEKNSSDGYKKYFCLCRFIGTNYVIMQDMLKSIQRKNTMNY